MNVSLHFFAMLLFALFLNKSISYITNKSVVLRLMSSSSSSLHPATTAAAAVSNDDFQSQPRPQVIVLCGPTSVGKSAVARELCRRPGVEVLVADAVQVYRHLDIGANKPSREEMAATPHHLVDVVEPPGDTFTAGDFVRRAVPLVQEVLARGHTPLFVGGNTMWVQWLTKGTPDAPRGDEALRGEVRGMLADSEAAGDWEAGLRVLRGVDPLRAAKLSRNDWYRLSRYMEVALAVQRRQKEGGGEVGDIARGEEPETEAVGGGASVDGTRRAGLAECDVRCFFIAEDREQLYHTIDARCLQMLRAGLLEEVEALLLAGRLPPDFIGTRSIGYRQTIEYLLNRERTRGDLDCGAFLEFLNSFASATRNYARKQLQWYRRDPSFLWLRISRHGEQQGADSYERVGREIAHWLALPREAFDAAIQKQMAWKDASPRDMPALEAAARSEGSARSARSEVEWSAEDVWLRRAEDARTTKMRRYVMQLESRDRDFVYRGLVARADECSRRLAAQRPGLAAAYEAFFSDLPPQQQQQPGEQQQPPLIA